MLSTDGIAERMRCQEVTSPFLKHEKKNLDIFVLFCKDNTVQRVQIWKKILMLKCEKNQAKKRKAKLGTYRTHLVLSTVACVK